MDLYDGVMLAFVWRDRGKPRNTSGYVVSRPTLEFEAVAKR
jgi:hypothetical protein